MIAAMFKIYTMDDYRPNHTFFICAWIYQKCNYLCACEKLPVGDQPWRDRC